MHKITLTTRQGNPVKRLSKTQARKAFDAGLPITATVGGSLPDGDPDVFKDDGTDPMLWPSHTDFDALSNEWHYYSHNGKVWYWGFNTPSGLEEGN